MGIFSTIVDKIFHHPSAGQMADQLLQQARSFASAPAAQTQPAAEPSAAPAAQPSPAPAGAAAPPASTQPAPVQGQPQGQPAPQVDVEAVLTRMAEEKGGGGNWRTSIVDLLKLLDMDSSLEARKQLANELDEHSGPDGSAEENIALHRAVMRKLEENGGKVPETLKSH